MMQELFFDCIRSLVKSQRNSQSIAKSGSTSPHEVGPAVGRPRTINQILQTKKQFDRLADISKQEVLVDFVQNKAVLQAIYECMFSLRNMRDTRRRGKRPDTAHAASGVDLNRLYHNH